MISSVPWGKWLIAGLFRQDQKWQRPRFVLRPGSSAMVKSLETLWSINPTFDGMMCCEPRHVLTTLHRMPRMYSWRCWRPHCPKSLRVTVPMFNRSGHALNRSTWGDWGFAGRGITQPVVHIYYCLYCMHIYWYTNIICVHARNASTYIHMKQSMCVYY